MEYHVMGMNMVWWIIWLVLIFAIFFFPSRRTTVYRETPLDILQKKYAGGKMSTQEYQERKTILERDTIKNK